VFKCLTDGVWWSWCRWLWFMKSTHFCCAYKKTNMYSWFWAVVRFHTLSLAFSVKDICETSTQWFLPLSSIPVHVFMTCSIGVDSVQHRHRLGRSNRELCRGTHGGIRANITFLSWYFSGTYFDVWSESAIITLITFIKCSSLPVYFTCTRRLGRWFSYLWAQGIKQDISNR